jgi:hypothetical protein
MGKAKVPPQLKGHAFGKGTAKAAKVGAKGGRKSPDMADGGSETSATAKRPPAAKATPKRMAAPKAKAAPKAPTKPAAKATAKRTAKPKAKAPTKRT